MRFRGRFPSRKNAIISFPYCPAHLRRYLPARPSRCSIRFADQAADASLPYMGRACSPLNKDNFAKEFRLNRLWTAKYPAGKASLEGKSGVSGLKGSNADRWLSRCEILNARRPRRFLSGISVGYEALRGNPWNRESERQMSAGWWGKSGGLGAHRTGHRSAKVLLACESHGKLRTVPRFTAN